MNDYYSATFRCVFASAKGNVSDHNWLNLFKFQSKAYHNMNSSDLKESRTFHVF